MINWYRLSIQQQTNTDKVYKRKILRQLIILTVFFIAISLFYIKLPMSGSLPGNHDTWGNLSMFLELESKLSFRQLFNQEAHFLYPYPNPWVAYGLDFFSGIIWIFFHKLGFSLIWSYGLYLITLLASNSLGLYILSQHFIRSKAIRFSIALAFSLHVIIYSNIDTPNVLSYFFYFISLHYLFLFFKQANRKNILMFSIFSGLQIYASPTVFIFLFFSSFTFVIIENKFRIFRNIKFYSLAVLVVFLILFPYAYAYIFHSTGTNLLLFLDIDSLTFSRYLSFQWQDLFSIHPASLLNVKQPDWEQNIGLLKNAFPGFIIMGLVVVSLFIRKARKFIVLFSVLFLVGSGQYIFLSESLFFANPIDILMGRIDFYNLFRIPARINIVLLFCLLCMGGVAVENIISRLKHKKQMFLIAILSLIVLESSLWKAQTYLSENELNPFLAMNEYINDRKEEYKTILNIPSDLLSPTKDGREFKYVINRFYQDNRTLNGSVAYLPESRIYMWKLLNDKYLDEERFCSFLHERDVDGVLVFEDYIEDTVEYQQVSIALSCNCLEVQHKKDNITLLKLK